MKTLTAAEVLNLDLPPRRDVVAGLLPCGSAALLAGAPKVGKSLVALDLAAAVAAGEPWAGRQTAQGPALVIALEESASTIQARLRARVGDATDLPLHISLADGGDGQDPFDLGNLDSIMALGTVLDTLRPVLVVLDVLRESHGADENDASQMGPLLRPLRQLAHQHDVCVMVLHHAAKHGGYRGSSAIAGSHDTLLEMTSDGDDGGDLRAVLTAKGRDVPRQSLRIALDPDTYRWAPASGAPPTTTSPNAREAILRVLDTDDRWMTANDLAAVTGLAPKTIGNALAGMMGETYCPMLVRGTGTRTDPRAFHGVRARLVEMVPGTFPESSGTNGHGPPVGVLE